MEQHLKAFIETHPDGWDHFQWLGLLADLEDNGFDVSDPTAIGRELENHRLAWELRRREVPGLGPKRIDAVVEHFGTLWSLRHADVEDFADIKKSVPGKVAEKVVAAVR
jgi:hypothetical protein